MPWQFRLQHREACLQPNEGASAHGCDDRHRYPADRDANGESLRTRQTGGTVAGENLDKVHTGFIGLQVPALRNREEPPGIRCRNTRLKELPWFLRMWFRREV